MKQQTWALLYNWFFLPCLWLLAKLVSFRNANLRAALKGRKGFGDRLEKQGNRRDLHKPLVWFHVASAGEFLQAQPLLNECYQYGWEYALTFTSVNGYKWIQKTKFPENNPPLLADYLPFDSLYNVRQCLAILHPSAIVYVKFDLWPNLVWEAYAQRLPQLLISCSLSPQSAKIKTPWGRSLFRTLYPCLNAIFTVTLEDKQRLLLTNPEHPKIEVTGDTRVDSVLQRRAQLPSLKLPDYVAQRFVFIAGSTWPPDEDCIFPALKAALTQFPDLLLLIVPHEPMESHLKPSETFFHEFPLVRWSQLNEKTAEVRIILMDTVGILSSLYEAGHLAYIGGAFTTGVHNTLEPCAMGVPVIFGPRFHNSPEAKHMVAHQLASTVSTPNEFHQVLWTHLGNRERCLQLGQQVQHFVESQKGASQTCFHFLKSEVERMEEINKFI
ncbi:glycosyltransferase N-terminal domain-containing protein [Deltaproteobacteria bacterium TL4]